MCQLFDRLRLPNPGFHCFAALLQDPQEKEGPQKAENPELGLNLIFL